MRRDRLPMHPVRTLLRHPVRTLRSGRSFLQALLISVFFFSSATIAAAQDGQAIFKDACAPCHRIGGGRLVGPDLAGVNERHPQDWLIRYIKSEDAMVKSGDSAAIALREEYKMPMPDQPLSDPQIKAILDYIKSVETSGATTSEDKKSSTAPSSTPAKEAQPGEIQFGKDLFEGRIRFANRGPSCNACHSVTSDSVLGGGILASDLTSAFTRTGREGLRAIIRNAPFPVMQVAYAEKGVSEDEATALIAFFQKTEQEHARQTPKEWGWRLFGAGIVGVVLLAGIAGFAGRGRKKGSVNQDIYDRQIRSC